jgi:23S rRNA (uracil1939-C5)-methyltransferase
MNNESGQEKTVIVTFDALAYGGDAVGRSEGRVIFVPGCAPGDTARVGITEDKGTFLRGRLISIENPSKDRIAPFCPHAAVCGGCQWQHIPYDTQLFWKHRIVEESLRRIAGLGDISVEPCVPSPIDRGYRSSARFPVGQSGDDRFAMGYFARNTNDIVDIDTCPVSTTSVDTMYTQVREQLKKMSPFQGAEATIQASWNRDSLLVDILLKEQRDLSALSEALCPDPESGIGVTVRVKGTGGGARTVARRGPAARVEVIGGAEFRISGGSFFQVNAPQAEHIAELVRELLADERTDSVMDGYGGVGLFSFAVFSPDTRIVLFDTSNSAVADSRYNAQVNGYHEFSAVTGGMTEALEKCPSPDVVVLDPPRTGIGRRVAEAVGARKVPVVVMISCNPATLARDLKVFHEQGYSIERVIPLDMFPQTYHIECVVKLVRDVRK